MAQYTNDAQLNAAILNDFQGIIDKVAEDILQEVLDSIEDVVYGAGTPKVYERWGKNQGLLDIFYKTDAQIIGQSVQSNIDNDPSILKHEPDFFIHGSNYSKKGDDVREVILDIITEGLSGYLFGPGWWQYPRDFFTPLINKIKRGDLDHYLESEMSRRNIQWKKI